jgi:hypothetical protein
MLSLLMLVMKDKASNILGVAATTMEDSQAIPMDKDALVHVPIHLHLMCMGMIFQPAAAVFPLHLGEDALRVLYPKDLPRASHRCHPWAFPPDPDLPQDSSHSLIELWVPIMLHQARPTPAQNNNLSPTPSSNFPIEMCVVLVVLMSNTGTQVCHARRICVKQATTFFSPAKMPSNTLTWGIHVLQGTDTKQHFHQTM